MIEKSKCDKRLYLTENSTKFKNGLYIDTIKDGKNMKAVGLVHKLNNK